MRLEKKYSEVRNQRSEIRSRKPKDGIKGSQRKDGKIWGKYRWAEMVEYCVKHAERFNGTG
jgi:hypothetical protein